MSLPVNPYVRALIVNLVLVGVAALRTPQQNGNEVDIPPHRRGLRPGHRLGDQHRCHRNAFAKSRRTLVVVEGYDDLDRLWIGDDGFDSALPKAGAEIVRPWGARNLHYGSRPLGSTLHSPCTPSKDTVKLTQSRTMADTSRAGRDWTQGVCVPGVQPVTLVMFSLAQRACAVELRTWLGHEESNQEYGRRATSRPLASETCFTGKVAARRGPSRR